jgi:hypothetical protein
MLDGALQFFRRIQRPPGRHERGEPSRGTTVVRDRKPVGTWLANSKIAIREIRKCEDLRDCGIRFASTIRSVACDAGRFKNLATRSADCWILILLRGREHLGRRGDDYRERAQPSSVRSNAGHD